MYDTIPAGATGTTEKFNLHISEEKLSEFKQLVKLSPIGPATYENAFEDRRYGVTRSWLVNAKKTWEKDFDWYMMMFLMMEWRN
jgi:microsomal epoxide hydrolase